MLRTCKIYFIFLFVVFYIGFTKAQVNFQWAKSVGGTIGNDQAYSNVVDPGGNVYTTGYFEGTVDFDPGVGIYTLTSTSQEGIFVSKLDAAGNFVWAKSMAGSSSFGDDAYSIALDASGNIYTTGYFYGIEDFDPGPGIYTLSPTSNYEAAFISKLDAGGNFVWAKSFSSSGFNSGSNGFDIIINNSGDIYLTGSFYGTTDFDPGPSTFTLGPTGEDIFICKLDANGNFIWAKRMGSSLLTGNEGLAIALDVSGNVYTTGFFTGTADFDPGPGVFNFTSLGYNDVFISKLDASGNFDWAKQIGGSGVENGYSITLDGTGNVYTTGTFTGTVDFDPGIGTYTLTSTGGGYNAFISKLDGAGNFIWAKNISGSSSSNDITTDGTGNVFITGGFGGTSDFDPGAGIYNLTSFGLSDIFISKLDASGSFVWAQQAGGTMTDVGNSISVDATGNILLTGVFSNTADFDPGASLYNLTSNGQYDIFVLKLNSVVGIKEISGSNDYYINVYPNPSNGKVTIQADKEMSLNVVTELGQVIKKCDLNASNKYSCEINNLDLGVYFITNSKYSSGKKIVVIK